MERVKHHYCWLKVVMLSAMPLEEELSGEVAGEAWAQFMWSHGAGHGIAAPSTFSLMPPGSPMPSLFSLLPPGSPKKKTSSAQPSAISAPPAPTPQTVGADELDSAVSQDETGATPHVVRGLMFGGATFMGLWQFEQTVPGLHPAREDRRLRIVCQPVLGTREEALTWLDGKEGQAWRDDALSLALLAFVAVGTL